MLPCTGRTLTTAWSAWFCCALTSAVPASRKAAARAFLFGIGKAFQFLPKFRICRGGAASRAFVRNRCGFVEVRVLPGQEVRNGRRDVLFAHGAGVEGQL